MYTFSASTLLTLVITLTAPELNVFSLLHDELQSHAQLHVAYRQIQFAYDSTVLNFLDLRSFIEPPLSFFRYCFFTSLPSNFTKMIPMVKSMSYIQLILVLPLV